MPSVKSNPNIDLSKLHISGVSFKVTEDGSFVIFFAKTESLNTLSIEQKGRQRIISGILFKNNTIKIETVVIKESFHRTLFGTIIDTTGRTSDRIIQINGEKVGILEESFDSRNAWEFNSQPYYCMLDNWETLYYDNTTLDVQIYYKRKLFAVAKYFKGTYQFLIREDNYLLLCLGLALASIDSRENR